MGIEPLFADREVACNGIDGRACKQRILHVREHHGVRLAAFQAAEHRGSGLVISFDVVGPDDSVGAAQKVLGDMRSHEIAIHQTICVDQYVNIGRARRDSGITRKTVTEILRVANCLNADPRRFSVEGAFEALADFLK